MGLVTILGATVITLGLCGAALVIAERRLPPDEASDSRCVVLLEDNGIPLFFCPEDEHGA